MPTVTPTVVTRDDVWRHAPTVRAQNLDKNSISRVSGTIGTRSQVFRACEGTLFEASVLA